MTAGMKITVLGAGAWGTALAAVAARRHDVMLWGRDPEHIKQLRATRCNPRYLRDSMLPASLALSHDLSQAVARIAPSAPVYEDEREEEFQDDPL